MNSLADKKSHSRLLVAGALFFTSIIASLLIAYISSTGGKYWVLNHPLPRGVQISSTDISLAKVTLGRGAEGYLSSSVNPVGSITLRNLSSGSLLNVSDLSNSGEELDSESLSIAVRAADLPATINVGEIVSLYRVFDARNGEVVPEPERVISGVFIKEISQKGANFGGDLALTISIQRDEVPRVLAATSSGRLVVVASRG
ncbi:SAF_CpaB_FlgA_like domain containing protein [Candidatus Nanopelagicaceae bacterium]